MWVCHGRFLHARQAHWYFRVQEVTVRGQIRPSPRGLLVILPVLALIGGFGLIAYSTMAQADEEELIYKVGLPMIAADSASGGSQPTATHTATTTQTGSAITATSTPTRAPSATTTSGATSTSTSSPTATSTGTLTPTSVPTATPTGGGGVSTATNTPVTPTATSTPTPSPTPVTPTATPTTACVPSTPVLYEVFGSADPSLPRIVSVEVSDRPCPGIPIPVKVKITSSPTPIEWVRLTMYNDVTGEEIVASLISGSLNDGTWEATFSLEGTYDRNYRVITRAKNGSEATIPQQCGTQPCAPGVNQVTVVIRN